MAEGRVGEGRIENILRKQSAKLYAELMGEDNVMDDPNEVVDIPERPNQVHKFMADLQKQVDDPNRIKGDSMTEDEYQTFLRKEHMNHQGRMFSLLYLSQLVCPDVHYDNYSEQRQEKCFRKMEFSFTQCKGAVRDTAKAISEQLFYDHDDDDIWRSFANMDICILKRVKRPDLNFGAE